MSFVKYIITVVIAVISLGCASSVNYENIPGDSGTDIDKFIITKMKEGKRPGLSALVMSGDDILWNGYYGYADIENGIAITENTSFFVSSVSKLITATAIM